MKLIANFDDGIPINVIVALRASGMICRYKDGDVIATPIIHSTNKPAIHTNFGRVPFRRRCPETILSN